jgi:hypothetical protein
MLLILMLMLHLPQGVVQAPERRTALSGQRGGMLPQVPVLS